MTTSLTHRKPPPPELPLDLSQRERVVEWRSVYEAVVTIRKAGFRVFREGDAHRVNGALLSTRDLMIVAKAVENLPVKTPEALARESFEEYG